MKKSLLCAILAFGVAGCCANLPPEIQAECERYWAISAGNGPEASDDNNGSVSPGL